MYKIATTGLYSPEKETLEAVLEQLPFFTLAKTFDNSVKFVVAKHVRLPKYRQAKEWRIEVVKIDWVYECQKAGKLVDFQPFRLPPFSGLVISVTGFTSAEKTKVEEDVVQNGGTFSSDLRKDTTTHLIANKPEGEKYKFAKLWKEVQIVTIQWILDCVRKQEYLEEKYYNVKEYQGAFLAPEKNATKARSTLSNPSTSSLQNPSKVPLSAQVVSETTDGSLWNASVHQGHTEQYQGNQKSAVQSGKTSANPDDQDGGRRQQLSKAEVTRSAKKRKGVGSRGSEEEDEGIPWDSLYLSACRVFLCSGAGGASSGAGDGERMGACLSHGGAVREERLENATHVVVPRDVEESVLGEMSEALMQQRASGLPAPVVVWASWLDACVESFKWAPEEIHTVPLDRLQLARDVKNNDIKKQKYAASTNHSKKKNKEDDANSTRQHSVAITDVEQTDFSRSGFEEATDKKDEDKDICEKSRSRYSSRGKEANNRENTKTDKSNDSMGNDHINFLAPPPVTPGLRLPSLSASLELENLTSGVFHDLKFVVMTKWMSSGDIKDVEACVEMGGGHVIPKHDNSMVHYTVFPPFCPPSCPMPSFLAALESAPREGVAAAAAGAHDGGGGGCVVVSPCWIQRCLADGHLHPVNESPLYRPLTCPRPLPGAQAIQVCVSMYTDTVRTQVESLCKLLGARYTEVLKKRKTSHLVIKAASGPKYHSAKQWGIPVATKEWLEACAEAGRFVDHSLFQPQNPDAPPLHANAVEDPGKWVGNACQGPQAKEVVNISKSQPANKSKTQETPARDMENSFLEGEIFKSVASNAPPQADELTEASRMYEDDNRFCAPSSDDGVPHGAAAEEAEEEGEEDGFGTELVELLDCVAAKVDKAPTVVVPEQLTASRSSVPQRSTATTRSSKKNHTQGSQEALPRRAHSSSLRRTAVSGGIKMTQETPKVEYMLEDNREKRCTRSSKVPTENAVSPRNRGSDPNLVSKILDPANRKSKCARTKTREADIKALGF